MTRDTHQDRAERAQRRLLAMARMFSRRGKPERTEELAAAAVQFTLAEQRAERIRR